MLLIFKKYFQDNLHKIRQKNSFAQNLLIALSGSVISTAIGFLLTPIVTRIYSPEAYGLFSVFYSIVNNAASVALLMYAHAFVLPKQKEQFYHLVQLTLILAVASSLILLIAAGIGGDNLAKQLNIEKLGNLIYFIPLIVLINSLNMIMHMWNLRNSQIKRKAMSAIFMNISSRTIAIAYGTITHGALNGLILGEFVGILISFITLINRNIFNEAKQVFSSFSFEKIRLIASQYRNYPVFILPSTYFFMVSTQMPIYLLTASFGTYTVGLFAFASSMLEIAGRFFGEAISPVFLQKASETHQDEPEALKGLTLNIYQKLLYVSVVPFGIVTVFGEWIFRIVFGTKWVEAGILVSFLGCFYIFKVLYDTIESVYKVLGKERLIMIFNIALLVLRFASLLTGMYFNSFHLAIMLFSLVSLVFYLFNNLYLFSLLKLPTLKIGLKTILLIVATYGALYLLKQVAIYYLAL